MTALSETDGDRRVVTVLFADISGFTAMAEELDPEDVARILGNCFEAITAPILAAGGTVDKYMGDAVMALFGAPVSHGDDAERALHAALAMQEAAARFSRRLERERGIPLALRIGINSGLVVAGHLGGQAYTVLGDTVNLAQRMEAAAEPGTVLVAPETRRLAGERFRFVELESIQVKGKRLAIRPYRLLEACDGAREPVVDLFGRERELEELRARWQHVLDGRPQACHLVSEAGMGKTSLIQAFGRLLGAEVLWGYARCQPFCKGPAFETAARLLAQVVGLEQAEQLSRGPGHVAGRALAAAATHRPMALALDDLQWSDEPTRSWWEELHEGIPAGTRIFLVGATRPDGPGSLRGGRLDVLKLYLGPISFSAELACFGALAGIGPDPEIWNADLRGLGEHLVARSEGNPLFLRELATAFQQGMAPDELPLTINGVLSARLDRLEPGEREILQVASLLGREFDREILARLLFPAGLDAPLASLVRQGLLRPLPAGHYAFDQALLQEVAYAGMLRSRRQALHGLTARALEEAGAAPAEIAHHLSLAGEAESEASRLFLAGEEARCRHAPDQAPDKTLNEAYNRYEQALAAGAPAVLASQIRHSQAKLLMQSGDPAAAMAKLERLEADAGLDPARPLDAGSKVATLGLVLGRAWLEVRLGRFSSAERRMRHFLAVGVGGQDDRAMATSILGIALDRQGRWDLALEAHREALAIREQLADEAGIASSLNNLGMVLSELGRWDEAAECYSRSLAAAEQLGDTVRVAALHNNLGDLALREGDLAEAQRRHRQALALRKELGDASGIGASLCALGDALARAGNLADGVAMLQEGIVRLEAVGSRELLAEAHGALGRAQRMRGDGAEAEESLARAIQLGEQSGAPLATGVACRELARLAVAKGDLEQAGFLLDRAIGLLSPLGNQLETARCELLTAELRYRAGDTDRAVRLLGRARATFAALGARRDRDELEEVRAMFFSAEHQACRPPLP